MNGLIITNQTIGHNQYKIHRFIEEFSKINIELDCFVNDGTLAFMKEGTILCNLPKADFVLYLDKDIYLAKMLEKIGYRLFNKVDFIKFCDDKILTFIGCSNLGIRMPKTYACPLIYDQINESNYLFLDKVSQELGFPMIVKKVYGSLGEGVYLVKDISELKNLYSTLYSFPILFQEYIPSNEGRSLRIMIIDGQVIGGFERYNASDFRSNFGNQASAKILKNPAEAFLFAQDVANKLNIEYAGIDLLLDKNNEPILCEINSNAFFEEFEKVTKINVAEKIAYMVRKKIYEQE